jgi:putative membrane protein
VSSSTSTSSALVSGIQQQIQKYSFSSILGALMIALGVALIFYALKSYRDRNKQIESGVYVPKKSVVYAGAKLLATFGAATVLYLLLVSLL